MEREATSVTASRITTSRRVGCVPTAAPILWITGLSGAGKSALAWAVLENLRADGIQALMIDGDLVRHALDSPAQLERHDAATRLHRAWRIAELARIAALQGMPVVVATIALFHAVQAWNRAGPAPYAEVVLTAEIDELKRRKTEVYSERGPVVGIDITPEFPTSPELVLVQRFVESDLPIHVSQVMTTWRGLCRP